MKKFLKIISLMVLILFVFWGCSLLRCEYLTQKYYDDFEYAYTANTMLGDMEYFKVLYCDGKYAEVYYIGKDMNSENVLTFSKKEDEWVYSSWQNTICLILITKRL